MPYVQRDTEKNIISISSVITDTNHEYVDSNSDEIKEFLRAINSDTVRELGRSDNEVARVFEDLVDILIRKGVIEFTDLPAPAQKKLIKRQVLRDRVSSSAFQVDYDDDNISFD